MERLPGGNEIGAPVRKPGLVGVRFDVTDILLFVGGLRALDHPRIGLDTDDLVGSSAPGARRETCSAAEVDDETWSLGADDEGQHVEHLGRRGGTKAVVDVREARVQVAGPLDQLLGEFGHDDDRTDDRRPPGVG